MVASVELAEANPLERQGRRSPSTFGPASLGLTLWTSPLQPSKPSAIYIQGSVASSPFPSPPSSPRVVSIYIFPRSYLLSYFDIVRVYNLVFVSPSFHTPLIPVLFQKTARLTFIGLQTQINLQLTPSRWLKSANSRSTPSTITTPTQLPILRLARVIRVTQRLNRMPWSLG